MNPIRKAHGNGAGALLRTEVPPIDEIRPPNATETEHGLAVREASGRPFEPGNDAASNRLPKLARIDSARPEAHALWRDRYRKQADRLARRRVRELSVMFGGRCSVAAADIVKSAAMQSAWADLLFELAAQTLDPKLAAQAARMRDMSRVAHLTAVGLCRLEADAFVEDDETRNRRVRIEAQQQRAARLAAGTTIDVTLIDEEKKVKD